MDIGRITFCHTSSNHSFGSSSVSPTKEINPKLSYLFWPTPYALSMRKKSGCSSVSDRHEVDVKGDEAAGQTVVNQASVWLPCSS